MPSSYTALYYHVVFGTKDRRPLITTQLQPRLHDYMGGIIAREKGRLLAAGGTADHVHLLVTLPAPTSLSDLMRLVKANSSQWVHETFPDHSDFRWQDGFGAFTVSQSNVDQIKTYIARQEQHHLRVSFQDEFLAFLKRHGIQFDERYLWE